MAVRPSGTIRSLSPLPRTCTRPRSSPGRQSSAPSPLKPAARPHTAARESRDPADPLPAPADAMPPSPRAPASPPPPARPATWAAPSMPSATRCSRSGRGECAGPAAATCKSRAGSSACVPPIANRSHASADARGNPPHPSASAHQQAMSLIEKLRKGPQITQVGFAGQRPQSFFHAQIRLIILQQRQVGACCPHFRLSAPFCSPHVRSASYRTSFIKESKSLTRRLGLPHDLFSTIDDQTCPIYFVIEPYVQFEPNLEENRIEHRFGQD